MKLLNSVNMCIKSFKCALVFNEIIPKGAQQLEVLSIFAEQVFWPEKLILIIITVPEYRLKGWITFWFGKEEKQNYMYNKLVCEPQSINFRLRNVMSSRGVWLLYCFNSFKADICFPPSK